MTEATAWMSSWPGSVRCMLANWLGPHGGHTATETTVASGDNQRRRFRKSGVSNVGDAGGKRSACGARCRLVAERREGVHAAHLVRQHLPLRRW
jgi:hypothetical protein